MEELDNIITKHADDVVTRLISSMTEVQAILGKDFATLQDIATVVRRFNYNAELTVAYFNLLKTEEKGIFNVPLALVGWTLLPDKDKEELAADELAADELAADDADAANAVSPETERAIQKVLDEEKTECERQALLEEKMTMEFLMEEAKEKQKKLDQKTYQCDICFEDSRIDQIYILEECFHRYCRECLSEHCKTHIQDGNTRKITCPTVDCQHIISYAEVQHVVDGEMLEKYETFLLRAALTDDPDCVWCARPGCDMAMIANGGIMMVCPSDACGFAFCRSCQEPWHADSTCEQYKQWKIDNGEADARYEEWARRNTKNCPGCTKPIQKNGGCNHMTCRQCGHEFCWICLEDYDDHQERDCERYS